MSDPHDPQPGQFPAPGQSGFPQPGFIPPSPGPAFGGPGQTPPGQTPPGQTGFGQPSYEQPNFGPLSQNAPIVGQDPPGKRSRGKMLAAIGGVVAVVAAGTFAVTQLRSNDSDGGASSPEQVGTDLTTALDNEDILGVVDLLLPGERETFRQPMIDVVDELKRLEITDDSADLGKVGGFDITIDDVDVKARETNVDDIQLVNVTANATVAINGEDLPIGDFLIEQVFGGDRPEVDEDSGDQGLDVTFAAVERGDRWYVSMFYSAANSIAGDADIPEEGILARGADQPEGALDNLIGATSNLDLETMISTLNPNEAEALQRYAPLFIDDAQNALDDVAITWKVSDTEYSVSGSGNRRQVGVDSFHFEAQLDDQTVEFDWKDGCLVGTTPDGEFDSCTAFDADGDSTINDYLDQTGIDNDEVRQVFTDLTEAFSDFSLHGVVVDKVDGKWFVSPIGSGSEAFLSVLRALDRDEIETLINDFSAVFEGGVTMPEIDMPADTIPDTVPDATIPDITIPDTVPDDTVTDDTVTDDTATDDTATDDTFSSSSWIDCLFDNTETADITGCVVTGVEAGTYDPTYIPAALLFPECGLAEYYLGFDSSTDDAATYLATIEPGRQCVVDAAALKGFDLIDGSPEFVHPECFTQDNPYNYDEPGEVDGYDCVAAAG